MDGSCQKFPGFQEVRSLYPVVDSLSPYLCATIGWFGQALAASADQLRFYGEPPQLQYKEILGNLWKIYVEGVIDIDAATRLEKYLHENAIPGRSLVFLNSSGGNLIGGMNLGRVIRKAGLHTYIGKKPEKIPLSRPGECYSACALAFLGGEYRFGTTGSIYGVHRFYFQTQGTQDADIAQIISASVMQYIRDMEVDAELFSVMTRAGASKIIVIPDAELVRLNVINNGLKSTKWSIESIPQGIYLKGERETYRGINKFMIACEPNGQKELYVIFDPEGPKARSDQIINLFTKHSIFIDDKMIPIDAYLIEMISLENGLINVLYTLTDSLLQNIANAHTVGIALQVAYDAPIFAGFRGMDFSDGAKKLPGFVNVCH